MQPRLGRPREAARVPTPPASTACRSACSRCGRTCCVALGRTHDPDNVARAVDGARDAGIDRVNLDLIYGTPGESDRRLGGHARRRARARARARERVRAHRRARHAARQGGRGRRACRARRRRPGDEVRARRRPPRRRRARLVRGLELGPARARSAATTSSTGRAATTPPSGAPPTGTRPADGRAAAGGTSARPSATSTRSAAGTTPRPGDEALDADGPASRAADPRAPHPHGIKLAAAAADPSEWPRCIDELATVGLLDRGRGDRVVLTRRGRLLANEVTARLLGALDQPPAAAGTR